MEEKLIVISLIIASVIIGGLIYSNGLVEEELYSDMNESNWCIPNTNITILSEEIEDNTSDGIQFNIIGKTIYKGKNVCQAEYNNGEETLVQYFTMKNDSITFIYKNESGIVNEFEINSSTTEDISDYYSE